MTYGGTTTLNNNFDWGKYNTIYYNGTSAPLGTWRTLTSAEWNYLLGLNGSRGGREIQNGTGLNHTHSFVSVNEVPGLLIYPDGYTGTIVTNTPNNSRISPVPINSLDDYPGCAFLPCAGCRGYENITNGTPLPSNLPNPEENDYRGVYWLSDLNDGLPYRASFGPMIFTSTFNTTQTGYNIGTTQKFCGFSVRLVTDVPPSN